EPTELRPTSPPPLSTGRREAPPLLACPPCYGLLTDMNRFATVIAAVRAGDERLFRVALPRRQNPGERLINCPQCRQPMLSHIYGGPGNVVIDSCERCQLNWLDPGELRRIAMAPDSTSSV